MSDWLDKAKEAAMQAAEEAKKLAEKAKNADYGAMLEKTKSIAKEAAEEARKAADSLRSKKEGENTNTTTDTPPDKTLSDIETKPIITPSTSVTSDVAIKTEQTSAVSPSAAKTSPDYQACLKQLEKVEALLREIKQSLQVK